MLVLSAVLVKLVKQVVRNKSEAVCLCASHYGTVGTVLRTERKYGFKAEEDLFKVVVREAVDCLNKEGYQVDQAGIDEHELSFNRAYYSKYSVVISNHFDYEKGASATLYTNESLAKRIHDIRNEICPVKGAVLRKRADLQMTSMKNGVILEWFKNNDQAAVDLLLVQAVDDAGEVSEKEPIITEGLDPVYTVKKDYKETGRFTCKQKGGIIGYKDIGLAQQVGAGQHLAYNEYTNYNHVYYVVDTAGIGFVVVRSASSGNFFPVRSYDVKKGFGTLWGKIV